MSLKPFCDRCNEAITEGAVNERGVMLKRIYCDGCVAEVDAYMQQRHTLHTTIVAQWREGLSELRHQHNLGMDQEPD